MAMAWQTITAAAAAAAANRFKVFRCIFPNLLLFSIKRETVDLMLVGFAFDKLIKFDELSIFVSCLNP